jgi:hypothetical protein
MHIGYVLTPPAMIAPPPPPLCPPPFQPPGLAPERETVGWTLPGRWGLWWLASAVRLIGMQSETETAVVSQDEPPLSPTSEAVRRATRDLLGIEPTPIAAAPAWHGATAGPAVDWPALASAHAGKAGRRAPKAGRRPNDYSHPRWAATARLPKGAVSSGCSGLSLLERCNPAAHQRQYSATRWHQRQQDHLNDTSLFGRYVLNMGDGLRAKRQRQVLAHGGSAVSGRRQSTGLPRKRMYPTFTRGKLI